MASSYFYRIALLKKKKLQEIHDSSIARTIYLWYLGTLDHVRPLID